MKDSKGIGARLRSLRQKNKFSQAEVAHMLCISQTAYCQIERNINAIKVNHLLKLCEEYNVTADFVLTGKKIIGINRKSDFCV